MKILENIKYLQESQWKSQLKFEAENSEKEYRIQQSKDRLKELIGPLLKKIPDEILLKIFGYLSTYYVCIEKCCTSFQKIQKTF